LTALADGDMATSVDLPNKVGDWIEIDLGKDQAVTEVDVAGKDSHFWQRFDIVTYFTGEKVEQASHFGHELDWTWDMSTRPELGDNGVQWLPYRGSGRGVRYIRLVCKEPAAGEKATASEIRVFGAKTGGL
jgi:hypothetical protein